MGTSPCFSVFVRFDVGSMGRARAQQALVSNQHLCGCDIFSAQVNPRKSIDAAISKVHVPGIIGVLTGRCPDKDEGEDFYYPAFTRLRLK